MESTAAGARKKKREEAGASEGGGTLRRRKAMVHLVALLAKKMKQVAAVTSEPGDDDGALKKEEQQQQGDSLFKEGEMLKLWQELREADHLWDKYLVPGSLDRWLQRKNPAPAADKKKKVVRVNVPDALIQYIMENPGMMRELSDDEMDNCPEHYREKYAIRKIINAKKLAYQKALIAQYQAFGFAYNEKEVTDDEEEVVVKN